MSDPLLWLTVIGFGLTAFFAITVKSLQELQWHELEEFCHQKKAKDSFGQIFDLRDQMDTAAGILQMIASAVGVVGFSGWMLQCYETAETWGKPWLWIVCNVAFLLVATGAWIPWAIAKLSAERFIFRTWRFWWSVSPFVLPLMVGGRILSTLLARASGQTDEISKQDEHSQQEEAFEDEILSMVSEGEHDGYLLADTRDMIEGVMELDDNTVSDVMTPRSSVSAIDEQASWDEMFQFVVESGRTRIPVYRETIDEVVGILYAKDLLKESLRSESKRRPLHKLVREPLLVPATTRLDEMLNKFLHVRTHMAVVRDEYGGMLGVITIEDILEEIVGEIVDETDKDLSEDIHILNDNQADVRGNVHLDRLNEALGIELPEDEQFATISGLIMSHLNEIPRSGHEMTMGNVQFNIQEANRRQIKAVRVTVLQDD